MGGLVCCGCGGSPSDTPADLDKGPTITPSMKKKAEEFNAKKEAAGARGKIKSKGGGRLPAP
jgi:hypothetical protein